MADPRVFISFDFDNDKDQRILFVGQTKNSKTPFDIQDWSSKTSLAQDKWEKEIKEKINKCNMLIVLSGENMATATGVVKEIKMAKEQNIPIFGVYVNGADSKSVLPEGLQRNRTVSWDWKKISNKIDEMMKDGKNKENKKTK